jgi:hypothetical protein
MRITIALLLFVLTASTASLHWGIPLLIAGFIFAIPPIRR